MSKIWITGKTLCEQNPLSIYLTKSEKEILHIHNPSDLSSESLYLCVKRFSGSISGAVVKEVQDILDHLQKYVTLPAK